MRRNVKVDDDVDVWDVEPSAGDVRRDEDVLCLVLEPLEGGEPLLLGHVAVERDGLRAEGAQHQGDFHRAGAGRAEDDEGVALGPNSIEKFWLEFWLKKPPYTKKTFKNG